MVSLTEVRVYVAGVTMLARNDRDGFSLLDLSADGFWRSFAAIVYAVPAFAVSWLGYRAAFLRETGSAGDLGTGFFVSLAMIDLINWILPILIVGLISAPLGISRNFGRWVIATNWLSLPIAYLMSVPVALTLMVAGLETIGLLFSLAFFAVAIALFFRITRLCFDNDVSIAVAITIGLVILTFTMTSVLQGTFGVALEPARP